MTNKLNYTILVAGFALTIKVYHDGIANPGFDTTPPRFGACLKLGYEHRF